MARPRSATQKTLISIRADQRLKERLEAMAYDLGRRARADFGPDEVNLSGFVREELEHLLEAYESENGGGPQLRADYLKAVAHRQAGELAQREKELATLRAMIGSTGS